MSLSRAQRKAANVFPEPVGAMTKALSPAEIASQALREYRVMLGAALTVGVTPVEIKEIVYHAVPYTGMGPAVDRETSRQWLAM